MKVVSIKFIVDRKLISLQTVCKSKKAITRNWLSKIAAHTGSAKFVNSLC
jgi:hypothetical protein